MKRAIQRAARPLAEGRRVAEVPIGLGYTAVLLHGGHAGAAYSFRDAAGGMRFFKAHIEQVNLALSPTD